jgi:hypothetical protein
VGWRGGWSVRWCSCSRTISAEAGRRSGGEVESAAADAARRDDRSAIAIGDSTRPADVPFPTEGCCWSGDGGQAHACLLAAPSPLRPGLLATSALTQAPSSADEHRFVNAHRPTGRSGPRSAACLGGGSSATGRRLRSGIRRVRQRACSLWSVATGVESIAAPAPAVLSPPKPGLLATSALPRHQGLPASVPSWMPTVPPGGPASVAACRRQAVTSLTRR